MLALVVAALAASTASPALDTSVPWWEKVTVTFDEKGDRKSCRYEASQSSAGVTECDKEMAESLPAGQGEPGRFSKFTFERRFSPGGQLDSGRLQPGDELLGRKVLFLTFDTAGSLQSCKVMAATGDMSFHYDCQEARKEKFRVQASVGVSPRQAFMTVLAYGHSEHIA